MRWIRWFNDLGIDDVPLVGGKNASLGEMLRELSDAGVLVPNGFAVTADGYRGFIQSNALEEPIRAILAAWQRDDVQDLARRSKRIRNLILKGALPTELVVEIIEAYGALTSALRLITTAALTSARSVSPRRVWSKAH